MRYGAAFVRSLIFVWLAAWVLADPIALLQLLLDPSKYSDAGYVLRQETAGTHFAKHHSDALVASSTEGSAQRSEDSQADEDELGAGSRADQQRLGLAHSVSLIVEADPSGFFAALTPPRAPPIRTL